MSGARGEALEVGLCREIRLSYGPVVGESVKVRGPADVAPVVRRLVAGDPREHFVALYLDGRHVLASARVVSVGTATSSLVHPREVFQGAILAGACAVVIAHNHPSGDPAPSREDQAITERLARAGRLLGIPLLDSVIVGDGAMGERMVSLKEEAPALFDKQPGEGPSGG